MKAIFEILEKKNLHQKFGIQYANNDILLHLFILFKFLSFFFDYDL
jgi:hypothetical protein